MQSFVFLFFFQAEDGIRAYKVTGVQTCALPICVNDGSFTIAPPWRADWWAQRPTQVQLADCLALGKGSRLLTRAVRNSWTRCGCEPPWPAPWVKLRCVFLARSYTPLVVKRRMGAGRSLAKSGTLIFLGIFASGSLAVWRMCGSCSMRVHSKDFFEP